MCRFSERDIDSKLFEVKVNHFHQGNASKRARRGKEFHTIARIIERETNRIVGYGRSWCCAMDCPDRRTGRAVAIGRAMKMMCGVGQSKTV